MALCLHSGPIFAKPGRLTSKNWGQTGAKEGAEDGGQASLREERLRKVERLRNGKPVSARRLRASRRGQFSLFAPAIPHRVQFSLFASTTPKVQD